MKREHIEQWTSALESEFFPQTKYELFRKEPGHSITNDEVYQPGYCSIGVGCLIFGLSYSYNSFREYTNLTSRQIDTLMILNDTKNYTFKQTSEWIKRNIEDEHTHTHTHTHTQDG